MMPPTEKEVFQRILDGSSSGLMDAITIVNLEEMLELCLEAHEKYQTDNFEADAQALERVISMFLELPR